MEGGLAGAINAVEDLLIHYVMTVGVAPILVSLAGAGLALLLMWIFSRTKSARR